MKQKRRIDPTNTILAWHRNHFRDFPWRKTDNPYEIAIAEILLQRTKAEQVLPVYEELTRKYPLPEKLANARLESIENTIRPLGLLKRGKMLKEFAKDVSQKHKGRIPKAEDQLLSLRGVGFYTANAVRCFAYGEDVAVVDWNIARFAKRFWGMKLSDSPHTDKTFIDFMTAHVPKGKGREFNYAMLDFLAQVCKPIKPECESCVVRRICQYKRD